MTDLTQKQWEVVRPHLPKQRIRDDGRGRPWREARDVLNGILWVLRCGARWKDLPERYPSYQTCHRRFQRWLQQGMMERVLKVVAEDLRDRGRLDLTETFIDGSFAPAKKGALWSAKPSVARGRRSWPLQTALVFLSPLGLQVLARMKYDSLKQRYADVLSDKRLHELSETKPTTVIHLMNTYCRSTEFNSLLLIREIGKANGLKTEEFSGAIVDGGK